MRRVRGQRTDVRNNMSTSRKYSEDEIKFMVEEYEFSPTKETVLFLAEKFETSPRSIIGKLSRLGVYQKNPYRPKYADKPVSKEELVANIARILDLDTEMLMGLEKSQKPALLYLSEQLEMMEKLPSKLKV